MLMVDVERGRADGIAMAKELEDGKLQKNFDGADSDDEIQLEDDEGDDGQDAPQRVNGVR